MIGPHGGANLPVFIRADPEFQTYCVNFSKVEGFDAHRITTLIFCVNGAADRWTGVVQLKSLRVGDEASNFPIIEDIPDQTWLHDTGTHVVYLTGFDHVTQCSLTGADTMVRNISFSPIIEGRCTLTHDLLPGVVGTAYPTLTAVGEEGYGTLARIFTLRVEDNLPPTITPHPSVIVQVGKPFSVRFTGVSVGNVFMDDRSLALTAHSSNPAVVADMALSAVNPFHVQYLYLRGLPTIAGDTDIAVTLDNQSGGNSVVTTTVHLRAVKQWNNPPTLDPIKDQHVGAKSGAHQLILTGISDGGDGKHPLTFTIDNSQPQRVTDLTIEYAAGDTAILHYNVPLAASGAWGDKVSVTVTVMNHGGTPDNNGDQSVSQSFSMFIR